MSRDDVHVRKPGTAGVMLCGEVRPPLGVWPELARDATCPDCIHQARLLPLRHVAAALRNLAEAMEELSGGRPDTPCRACDGSGVFEGCGLRGLCICDRGRELRPPPHPIAPADLHPHAGDDGSEGKA